MGILSDVWDYVRSKVKALIASAVTELKPWVRARIASALDAVDWVINNITKYITNVYKTFEEYVTNIYNTVEEYITNNITNITKNITNNITNINEYITNIIGITQDALDQGLADNREWMRNFWKLMDPTGFLKDPLGTVSAAFAIWSLAANNLAVKSFWEGFEEGLASVEEG